MKRQRTFCDGTSRRDMLRYGAAGLFGMGVTLPQLLQQKALAAAQGKSASDVSLIIVFLQGGLSTIDTLKRRKASNRSGESVNWSAWLSNP